MEHDTLIKKVGVTIANKLIKEMEDGSKPATMFAIALGVLVDFSDFLIIGQIPIIGTGIKLLAVIILTLILFDVGGFIKWKVRGIIWLCTFLEIIPVIATLPTYTLSMIWMHYKIKHRAAEAGAEIENILKEAKKAAKGK